MSKSALDNYLPPKAEKPLNASLLFPEIAREMAANPDLVGSLTGLFIVSVLKRGERRQEWFLLFQGRNSPPSISQTRPSLPKAVDDKPIPVVVIEIEDQDLYKFITGGLHGLKAISENRIKIAGDLVLAQQLEEVFIKTGGVEKTKVFMAKAAAALRARKAKL
ncbi:hypothetical protein HK105_207426 [Polyrhizophydium stewartii]|uniref:SCP2 domain-containing protein n=1 Tax=Polyrhizophydium stewartii TaxID=2732419 RepID=A0ABR4N0V9_9FUNG|nr:hypothetical protein HK105_005956 [Polyrhizophydium stewartii]